MQLTLDVFPKEEQEKLQLVYKNMSEDWAMLKDKYPMWPCFHKIKSRGKEKFCASCCNHIFMVSQLEFVPILEAINKMNAKERDRVVQEALDIFLQYFFPFMPISVDKWPEITRNLTFKEIRCPFLSPKDDHCLVYENRPFICRSYGGMTIGKEKDADNNPKRKFWSPIVDKFLEEQKAQGKQITEFIDIANHFMMYNSIKGGDKAPIPVHIVALFRNNEIQISKALKKKLGMK